MPPEVHDHVTPAELEIHVIDAFERSFELPDPLLDGDIEGGERTRRHHSRGGKAVTHLEALDGLGDISVKWPRCLVGGKIVAEYQALAKRSSWGPAMRARIWLPRESSASRRVWRDPHSSARPP